MIDLYHHFLYLPIYNFLVFLAGVLPGGDMGLAVVIVTLAVKLILAPVSFPLAKTQEKMLIIQPKLKELKETHKDDAKRQMEEMMALYKTHGVNPLMPFLILIIQLPILIALYHVVAGKLFAGVDTAMLYSFVPVPETLSPIFLGLADIAGPSIVLAFLAAASQLLYVRLFMPVPPPAEAGKESSMADEMSRAMSMQARFILPVVIGVFGYIGGGVIALYFLTSNVFMIAQQATVKALTKTTPELSSAV